ncbi:MAG TPA: hypothetical protein DHV05_05535 [Acholeplasmataceae bacterium]|nr:hypothetical protein [Acholeplasmataceae bacterium]
MPYLIVVGMILAFISIYMGAMDLNAKVAIPESCKEAYLEAQTCESCSSKSGRSSCSFNDALEFMKEVKL